MEIGSKIKELRLQRGLTQEELASRCELTKGYISQLENDIASPSIATLKDILNILGVSLHEFFAEEKEEKIVFSRQDFFESENGDGKNIWLIPNSQKNEMEPIILILKEGGSSETRLPFEGEEFGYVLEGKICIEFGKYKQVAGKGNAFYIDGKKEHKITNIGKTKSKILWVTTPSNF
ncbi:MAG: helix-turn-helix domain-containing protein [Bacillota bacterium]|jgi:transcriptional regulator with XRE-family HTH domain|nr:helix-turn-helix domain-containing protein [Bacillota bacterium]HHU42963.1 helix-turn-helix domain-containing protein [Clostridiales bacterium]